MIEVYCDMETEGGGWTVFQKRLNGNLDFFRNFADYEMGFGDLSSEFWLGLDKIKELAEQNPTTLRIQLTDVNDMVFFREYQDFSLTSQLYVLNIGLSSGTPLNFPGYDLDYHNGMAFSTFDSDNDLTSSNCADIYVSGWWHKTCYAVNVNGQYGTPGQLSLTSNGYITGIIHGGFAQWQAFKTSLMMIRRDT